MGETEISWTRRPGTVRKTWDVVHTKKRGDVARMAEHKLHEPLAWQKPATMLVRDPFHEGFSNEQIAAIFGVMAATSQHTYQILTKRAKRMREWFAWIDDGTARSSWMFDERRPNHAPAIHKCMEHLGRESAPMLPFQECVSPVWPLPNVWLGVTVENQAAADERVPQLRETPAAIRFLSCDPLLDHVAIAKWMRSHSQWPDTWKPPLDWVIAGCEITNARAGGPVEWLRALRDQCANAEVPFFLKQAVGGNVGQEAATPGVPPIGFSRHRPIDTGGGSRHKGGVIELPYLDGEQHIAFPALPLDPRNHRSPRRDADGEPGNTSE